MRRGALVPRGAEDGRSGVQRWARRWEPGLDGLGPGRFGAPVAVQRGEELGAGGRAGVVRKGRQAKQALAETRQVAAGERLGVLAWGPGSPWCGRREDRRAGRGAQRGRGGGGEGRGGARRYPGQTGAQTETGDQMDA